MGARSNRQQRQERRARAAQPPIREPGAPVPQDECNARFFPSGPTTQWLQGRVKRYAPGYEYVFVVLYSGREVFVSEGLFHSQPMAANALVEVQVDFHKDPKGPKATKFRVLMLPV